MRSEQLDIKVLLKQVYLAHTTKIKGLEDEVEELKSKLCETDRKLKNSESECKRCSELEEAFKSCQAALHEQSKWFENLGQKFSVFDHPESKATSNKTTNDSNNISKIHGEVSSGSQLSCLLPEKSSAAKMNLLKNLMSLSPEEYQDSLDLGTTPFPAYFIQDYSTMNSDSMILAPDTVDIVYEVQSDTKIKDDCKDLEEKNDAKVNKTKSRIMSPNEGKSKQSHNVDDIMKECQVASKPAKKRSLTESAGSDSKTKRLHKSSANETDCPSEIKKPRPSSKNSSSEAIPADAKSLKEKKSPIEVKKTKNAKTLNCDSSKSLNNNDVSILNNKNKTIPELDIQICKDAYNVSPKSIEKTKDSLANDASTTTKNSLYQVSPSLLPINDKKDKVAKQLLENEDIYDFQTPIVSKKPPPEEDSSWTACDKKKLKKGPSLKVKSSSKFKMSLDTLPPNYKKPVYRQTKLSKSIFQAKASNSKENVPDSNASPSLTKKDISNGKNTVDFDATCIPDNYEYQIIPSGSGIKGTIINDETENDGDIVLLNEDSMDGSSNDSSLIIMENRDKSDRSKCLVNDEEDENFEDFLKEGHKKLVCSENMNSFDRLPKKEEPNYKYKEETVRKKADRKQLNAFDCKECEKYYAELGLTDKEKQDRLKQCSRHRSKFAPPPTPEHFWELEFPDTQECKARGYLDETQKVKLKTHRRRPL